MCGELVCRRRKGPEPLRFIPACAGNSASAAGSRPTASVHPRVCGELILLTKRITMSSGSSPRVRGTLLGAVLAPAGRRFIPACAGNSQGLIPSDRHDDGSSPRVRGTLSRPRNTRNRRRFIPACAGNSEKVAAKEPALPVHPRVCGELDGAQLAGRERDGSSPRVRGTLLSSSFTMCIFRFIPACAGNSGSGHTGRHGPSVHPRVCGELPTGWHPGQQLPRFIPACAGNSRTAARSRRRAAVHPRVCGELATPEGIAPRDNGSSPRVRGTLGARARRGCAARFIPACAGNSCPSSLRPPLTTVHPRVCGELVRLGVCDAVFHRFIPACAGNSTALRPVAILVTVHPRVCGELSSRPRSRCARRSVHPRVCGELSGSTVLSRLSDGSSPRVRGTHFS